MFRILQQFIFATLFATFASQSSAMFIQADWFEVSDPAVGTNRYAYSMNDPINLVDPGGNVPHNPGGDTSTGLNEQDTENEYYTSHTDRKHDDYETYNYSSSTPHVDVSYKSYGGKTSVVYSNGHAITPGVNFGTTVYTGEKLKGAGNNPRVIDHATEYAYQGDAGNADGLLYSAATMPVGLARLPSATSTVLYGTSAPRVFWSGSTATKSVAGDAAAFAAQNGMKTLEMTRAGRAAEMATAVLGFKRTKRLWDAASWGFAMSAKSGSVAVLGTTVRSKSVWKTIERPILKRRGVDYTTMTIK